MSLQLFKKNLAQSLIQSQRDLTTQATDQMQMHDLLACFEEHTVYAQTAKNNEKDNNGFENDKAIEEATGVSGIG